jgi:hypothetical protein
MKDQSGNVLFLILIAVALFAALSYAVTQSTRGGGEGAESEKSTINAATLTQYPASLRTSILRMTISGTDIADLEFNAPSEFSDCSFGGANCVFHPNGGGATYAEAPAAIMEDGNSAPWIFNANTTITDIGTNTLGSGNDLVAYLTGVKKAVCEEIANIEKIDPIPSITTPGLDNLTRAGAQNYMDNNYTLGATTTPAGANLPSGPAQGFWVTSAADTDYHGRSLPNPYYTYYQVLVER